eukprot:1609029-Prymnesium_polylepis.3
MAPRRLPPAVRRPALRSECPAAAFSHGARHHRRRCRPRNAAPRSHVRRCAPCGRSMCWWELAEIERRFLLVGLYVVAPCAQGNGMQLALATLTAMIFLVLQSQAVPYRSRLDSTLATGCSFALCVLLTCCIFYKFQTLTQLGALQAHMSLEQRHIFDSSGLVLTVVFIGCAFGTLAQSAVLLAVQLGHDRVRKSRERRLVYIESGTEVPPPGAWLSGARRLHEMIHSGARDAEQRSSELRHTRGRRTGERSRAQSRQAGEAGPSERSRAQSVDATSRKLPT